MTFPKDSGRGISESYPNEPPRCHDDVLGASSRKLDSNQGCTAPEAAKSLGVDASSIRCWFKQFTTATTAGGSVDGSLKAELKHLRQKNKRLLLEREIFKSDGLLRQGAAMKFAWISNHAEEFPVDLMCTVLVASRSGYYAWQQRAESPTSNGKPSWPRRCKDSSYKLKCASGVMACKMVVYKTWMGRLPSNFKYWPVFIRPLQFRSRM